MDTPIDLNSGWNRRAFLRTMGVGAATLAAGLPQMESEAKQQPNILFVMLDDMAPDALFHERFPFLDLPNIERLAREGAVFSNMFVTTSLCSPSRASILTGVYGHIHGVRYNEISDPDPALPQFTQVLQEQGYTTAMIGKWHMAHHAQPRPGFDYWLSFRGQGEYHNPELNENGQEFQADGYITDILTQKTLDFLDVHTEDPFCILMWHKACHAPFEPAPRHEEAFPDGRFEEPESWSLDFSEKPRWMRREKVYGPHYRSWVESEGKPVPDRLEPEPWHPRPGRWLEMLRCLLAVDEGLGEVMDLLEQQGRLDNTIIIFMADNGWFYGEHRRGDKRLAYEESIKIPFAIRYPAKITPGSRIEGLASNIDIGPTLLDMTSAPIPDSMQGQSFVPLLAGKEPEEETPFFYVYDQEEYAPGIPSIRAIRTSEWKYIQFPYESADQGNHDELYHLKEDPYEMNNLIHAPEAETRLAHMKALLKEAMEKYKYTEPPYHYAPPNGDDV